MVTKAFLVWCLWLLCYFGFFLCRNYVVWRDLNMTHSVDYWPVTSKPSVLKAVRSMMSWWSESFLLADISQYLTWSCKDEIDLFDQFCNLGWEFHDWSLLVFFTSNPSTWWTQNVQYGESLKNQFSKRRSLVQKLSCGFHRHLHNNHLHHHHQHHHPLQWRSFTVIIVIVTINSIVGICMPASHYHDSLL